ARLSNGFNCGRAPTGKAAKALGRPLALIESKSWRSRARAARSARSMLKARFMLAQKFSRADRLAMAWALRPTARLAPRLAEAPIEAAREAFNWAARLAARPALKPRLVLSGANSPGSWSVGDRHGQITERPPAGTWLSFVTRHPSRSRAACPRESRRAAPFSPRPLGRGVGVRGRRWRALLPPHPLSPEGRGGKTGPRSAEDVLHHVAVYV